MKREQPPTRTLVGNARAKNKGRRAQTTHDERRTTNGSRPKASPPLPGVALDASSPIDLAERMDGLPSNDRPKLRMLKRTNLVDFPGRKCRKAVSFGDTEERFDRFLDSLEPGADPDLIA